MAVIDGVFCLNACVIYKCEMLSIFVLKWSEIMGTYNTPDIMARARRTWWVMK